MNISQKDAAKRFADYWSGKGYEKGQSQPFWLSLLREVYGIAEPEKFITFEDQVHLDNTSFIDGYIDSTHVMIEQKSIGKDLSKPVRQSDGSYLTPYQQAKRYSMEIPYSKRPRWIVTCNFESFLVYDMERPDFPPQSILLKDLPDEYWRLDFLVDDERRRIEKEQEISENAGRIVRQLYDALAVCYGDMDDPVNQKSLNKLIVRIVFCLYAEDAEMFSHSQFEAFINHYRAEELSDALHNLFQALDTPEEKRRRGLSPIVAAFPYTDGGLFHDSDDADDNVIPELSEEAKRILVEVAAPFNWSDISPTIFGGIFESTLNPDTRRKGGMHYTSVENIHKVIDPLFLDDLKKELDNCLDIAVAGKRRDALTAFQDRIASLRFLDPACGSGNFLTETYLSLRRLENKIIKAMYGEGLLGIGSDLIKVSIQQFYGIEINDFAVSVATTALWISEAQMLRETETLIAQHIDPLPLKSYTNILEGNALRMDWSQWPAEEDALVVVARRTDIYPYPEAPVGGLEDPVVRYGKIDLYSEDISVHSVGKKTERRTVKFDYIMGNPPFIGARIMSAEQKDDLVHIFGRKWKNIGNMDYVAGWYRKTQEMMLENPSVRAALVSTNSITQGEQVANLWKPLMESGIHIDFAYRTFRWDSESDTKAHVHCVIIGFSSDSDGINRAEAQRSDNATPSEVKGIDARQPRRKIYDGDTVIKASNINAYLIDAENVFVESRQHPLSDVPEIGIGNKPIDGGNYLFKDEDKAAFVAKEPGAEKYFRRWYGADEFINSRPRWCLWLGEADPVDLLKLPECMKRIRAVRAYRLASPSPGTVKLADRPTHFHVENMPKGNYIVIPETSSEKRPYVPIGFMGPAVLCSNAVRLLPDATLYHFGILTSSVHMAWTRAVCGRLKSDYRYSKDIVYNNFPWPSPTESQRKNIEETAQAILDAREKYPEASMADLYGNLILFPELLKAHRANDAAVMEAYGFAKHTTEAEIVSRLFKLYKEQID